MVFDPTCDYAGCRICGDVFQSGLDRKPERTAYEQVRAVKLRVEWRIKHDKTHTDAERRQLIASGRQCTPEAAQKLAPLGVYPLSDLVFSEETAHAMGTAPRMPTQDSES